MMRLSRATAAAVAAAAPSAGGARAALLSALERLAPAPRALATRAGGEGKEAAGEAIKETAKEFKKDGSVGQQFEGDGQIGAAVDQMAEQGALPKVFKKDGAIGRQFTSEGSVGGTVERLAEKEEQVGERMAQEGRARQATAKGEGEGSKQQD